MVDTPTTWMSMAEVGWQDTDTEDQPSISSVEGFRIAVFRHREG